MNFDSQTGQTASEASPSGPLPQGTPVTAPVGYVPGLPYYPKLDGIRALAFICVVVMHRTPFQWRFPGGWIGVDIFFVLSGYLITSILVREYDASGRISIGAFYRRRVLRLYPALVVCVLLGGVVTALGLADSKDFRSYVKPAGLALTYLTNVIRVPAEQDMLVHQTWSLAVEEQFYLIWPLLLACFLLKLKPRARLLAVAGLIAGLTAVRVVWYWLYGVRHFTLFPIYGRDDTLMCGAALAFAEAIPGWPILAVLRRLLGPAVAFLVFLELHQAQGPWTIYGLILVEIAAASLIASALSGTRASVSSRNLQMMLPVAAVLVFIFFWLDQGLIEAAVVKSAAAIVGCASLLYFNQSSSVDMLSRLLDSRWMNWIGKRSYGLYLYHPAIFVAVTNTPLQRYVVPCLVVMFGLTFGFAWFSYKYIETPFLRLKRVRSVVRSS